jgi:hypothetical protein
MKAPELVQAAYRAADAHGPMSEQVEAQIDAAIDVVVTDLERTLWTRSVSLPMWSEFVAEWCTDLLKEVRS